MNKQELKDWRASPVTKAVFKDIAEAVQEVQERSKIRETVDQTAMQVSRDEGFVEGVRSLMSAIEDRELEVEDED